jgi:predicted metalloprotease
LGQLRRAPATIGGRKEAIGVKRLLVPLLAIAVLGCGTSTPAVAPASPDVASASPGAVGAAPSEAPGGSTGSGGVAGATTTDCTGDDKACFEALVEEAAALADAIPADLEVEEPESFAGGQRNSSWLVYLVDTVVLVNRFWSGAFNAGGIPYRGVNYVIIDEGQPDQRSHCSGPAAGANVGPFYCALGGQGFGRTFQTGTIYVGIPKLKEFTVPVNPSNYDFAVVSVVAHEMAHHVEHELFRQSFASPTTATWWELSADCLAGVFAHAAYYGRAGRLTDSDVEEAIAVFYRLGSDLPYDYSGDEHGSRQQRVDAFMQGYNTGNTSGCLRTAWPTGF